MQAESRPMTEQVSATPKPVSQWLNPEITRLPPMTFGRRLARLALRSLARFLVWLFLDVQVNGMENLPAEGPALAVTNHLGDADFVLGLACTRRVPEVLAKADLYHHALAGRLLGAFGVIWIHRGQPDRRAIRAVLKGLAEGRLVALAPEGRESLTGGLEEGTNGAAYLALKAGVPLVPVTFTGTENSSLYANMKRLHKTVVSLTVGPLFYLEKLPDHHLAMERGTKRIMQSLANQLPPVYQGVYQTREEVINGSK